VVTYQPPPPWQQPPGPAPQNWLRRTWAGMSPLRRVGVILVGVVLLCCGGLSGIAAVGAAIDTPAAKPAADVHTAAPRAEQAVVTPSTAAPTAPVSTPESAVPAATTQPPDVQKHTVRENQKIAFKSRTVKDSSMAKGTREVRVRGVAGVRTRTYEVTVTDGVQTGKRLVSSKVTRRPVTKVTAVGTRSESGCDPNYSGECVPVDSDVDCGGGSGNGPSYVYGVVKVIGTDIYDLDRDNDGYGCD
jgi:hypothetical protein